MEDSTKVRPDHAAGDGPAFAFDKRRSPGGPREHCSPRGWSLPVGVPGGPGISWKDVSMREEAAHADGRPLPLSPFSLLSYPFSLPSLFPLLLFLLPLSHFPSKLRSKKVITQNIYLEVILFNTFHFYYIDTLTRNE